MRNTADNLLKEITKTIMADDYDTATSDLMRAVLRELEPHINKTHALGAKVFYDRIREHEERNRLKASDLTESFIKQLPNDKLSKLLTEIIESGETTDDLTEKQALREKYKLVNKEMQERFNKE